MRYELMESAQFASALESLRNLDPWTMGGRLGRACKHGPIGLARPRASGPCRGSRLLQQVDHRVVSLRGEDARPPRVW